MGQATDMCIKTLVLVERLDRDSPPDPRANYFAGEHACFRANYRAALHANVISKANLATNYAIVFNCDATTDTCLRSDDHALTDITVVTHVDHVVELGSFADSRPAQRRSIYG